MKYELYEYSEGGVTLSFKLSSQGQKKIFLALLQQAEKDLQSEMTE